MGSRTRPTALATEEIERRLAGCAGWRLENAKLRRDFEFRDFSEAFGFMARAALAAESLDHHPEWFNVYGRVRVELSTHDAGGVSELDFELAHAMNAIAD